MRAVLERPGVLEDLGGAYDSPRNVDTADEWIALIRRLVWIQGEDVARVVGDGPLITDDRPLPEYFLLRRMWGEKSPQVSPAQLEKLARG
jgi:hypothetical protein